MMLNRKSYLHLPLQQPPLMYSLPEVSSESIPVHLFRDIVDAVGILEGQVELVLSQLLIALGVASVAG